MSTDVFLAAHPQRTLFNIGGSWMHGFPEAALLDRAFLLKEIKKRLPDRSDEYTEWLCDQMWEIVRESKWDVCIVHEGHHDVFIEDRGYKHKGTYFPLR